ncbi:MAG: hypothetical protein LBQ60_02075 [Bacteroidales bacterium]|jgi:antitoxin component YwqK of YwqJK toxin-antitoxin module|nr:hypothetical protein [Bacteroidales bacterium]
MIKEGTGTYTSYYPDGTSVFETGEIENGYRTGIWRFYANMGYIITESTYADGDLSGIQRSFYEDGTPYAEGDMVNGLKEGVWQWYHTNGILSSSVTYSKGKKEGKQTMWDENGRKIKEEYYKNGIFEKDELF